MNYWLFLITGYDNIPQTGIHCGTVVEHWTCKQKIMGSNPRWAVQQCNEFSISFCYLVINTEKATLSSIPGYITPRLNKFYHEILTFLITCYGKMPCTAIFCGLEVVYWTCKQIVGSNPRQSLYKIYFNFLFVIWL